MGKKIKWEYFRAIYPRYRKGTALQKTQILDEFCEVCGYNRRYAIAKLKGPFSSPENSSQESQTLRHVHCSSPILQAIWEASGYPLVSAAKSAPDSTTSERI